MSSEYVYVVSSTFYVLNIPIYVNKEYEGRICSVCGGVRDATLLSTNAYVPRSYAPWAMLLTSALAVSLSVAATWFMRDKDKRSVSVGSYSFSFRSPIRSIEWQSPIMVHRNKDQS